MLDPLSALSLASSIFQIIDFGCKLVSQTQEIYSSANGATRHSVTVAEITNDVLKLYVDLNDRTHAFSGSSADDIALGDLAEGCTQAAKDLLDLLKTLNAPPGATQWKSLRVAIRTALKQSKVRDLEARLLKIQRQVDRRINKMVA